MTKLGFRSRLPAASLTRSLWLLLALYLLCWLWVTRYRELVASESIRRLQLVGAQKALAFLPDLLLALGIGLITIALSSLAGRSRRWSRALFASISLLVAVLALLETLGHQFLLTTGSLLDSTAIHLAQTNSQGMTSVVLSELPPSRLVVLAISLLVPLALAAFAWPRLRAVDSADRIPGTVTLILLLSGLIVLALSFYPIGNHPAAWNQHTASLLLPRDALGGSFFDPTEIDLAGVDSPRNIQLQGSNTDNSADAPLGARPASPTSKQPNLVLIVLESTGYRATSLDPDGPATTPFLASLVPNSVVASGMRAIIPHTTKALTAIHCGIEPLPVAGAGEAEANAIPTPCLANLLHQVGYQTAFFQAASQWFENRRQLIANFGFSEFFSGDAMDHEGLQRANYYGFDDMILLPPVAHWLEQHAADPRAQPHLLSILTNGPHHDYQRVDRMGWNQFDPDDEQRNRYLNLVRIEDRMVERVFDLYRKLGLYRNTVFIIVGDHGEAFGEHGRTVHDNVPWDEALRVPFLIHDGRSQLSPQTIDGNTSQIDILPTIAGILGYSIDHGSLPGINLLDSVNNPAQLQQLLADRTLFFSCWFDRNCLGGLRDGLKLIHHFDRRPEELYRLAVDPLELDALQQRVGGWSETTTIEGLPPVPEQTVTELRRDLFIWRERSLARYQTDAVGAGSSVLLTDLPTPTHQLRARFGSKIELLGYDQEEVPGLHGATHLAVTLYYRALEEFDHTITGAEAKRRLRAASQYQIFQTYDLSPGSGLHAPRTWRAGDLIRDRVVLTRFNQALGHPLFARLAFLPGDGRPPLGVRLRPNEAGFDRVGDPSIDGNELVFPLLPAIAPGQEATWVLRKRPRPQLDFVKPGGWRRLRLRKENPLRGFVSLFEDDGTSSLVAGWAGDAQELAAVDLVLAFHQGRPIARAIPRTPREDLTKYPKGVNLAIEFRLVGDARRAYRNHQLDFVAFRGRRRVGRIVRLPSDQDLPPDAEQQPKVSP